MADTPEVVVAALTYRRPDELRRILPLLVEQAAGLHPPARVLIVDNDPDGSAKSAVADWAHAGVDYAHEPRPGIAAGRNRALDEAATADAVVFIDDDETPAPGWLSTLVAQWRAEGCAAVGGAVIKTGEGELDPWVAASGLFDRWQFPTGTRVAGGATNNLLLDLPKLRALGLRFDDRFGLTGGSDTMLLKSMVRRGAEIVWCDEAQVFDPLPAHRLTRDWVLRRNLRTGNTWGRVHVALEQTPTARMRARVRLALHALRTITVCSVRYVRGLVTSRLDLRATSACRIASACGVLMACSGHVYAEYLREPAARRRPALRRR